ncbi:MAG: ATP-binding protein [Planctomycetota bacterium]|jgi:predicted AAA+ superfamily ATPase|nr:ATP-binding protein [Planctomycetota bacterium]
MLKRTLTPPIKRISRNFPALLLTGMRQVGKSTLLKMAQTAGRRYVSLDHLDNRDLAQNQPALFVERYEPPVIIDEIQYAPQLFPYLKIYIDSHPEKNGLFWLTGSQKFSLMKGVQESLAGRVAILDLLGLSYREMTKKPYGGRPFLPAPALIKHQTPPLKLAELYKIIWQGSFPRLITHRGENWSTFYKSYWQTYIERDVRDALDLRGNEIKFHNFVRAVAARTGAMLNYAEIGRDAQIDQRTARAWLSALVRAGLVKIIEPYYRNPTTRLLKTPRAYFLDTGLCAYLTGMNSPETLEAGYLTGAILETYALGEILKSYWHHGEDPNLYFYRDADQREIDFILETNNTLYPIEVKKTATPTPDDARHFGVLKNLPQPTGCGAVICLRPSPLPLTENAVAIPAWGI